MTNVFQKISAIIYSLMAITLLGCAGYSLYIILLDGIFYPPKIIAFALFAATAIAITTIAFFITKAAFKGKNLYKLICASAFSLVPCLIYNTLSNIIINSIGRFYFIGVFDDELIMFPVIMTFAIIATLLNILAFCLKPKQENENIEKNKNAKSTKTIAVIFGTFAFLSSIISLFTVAFELIRTSLSEFLEFPHLVKANIVLAVASTVLTLATIFILICTFSKTNHKKLLITAIIGFILFICLSFFVNFYYSTYIFLEKVPGILFYAINELFNTQLPSLVINILKIIFSSCTFYPLGLFTFIKLAKKYNEN